MTVKRLIGSAPSQVSRNRDLGTMAFQDVSGFKGPLFYAYQTVGQTGISATTMTKVTFTNILYDTSNCYNTSTSRFTPNIPGYYQINATVGFGDSGGTNGFFIALFKSGSQFVQGSTSRGATGTLWASSTVSSVVYLNGTTDYVEIYGYWGTSSGNTAGGQAHTSWSGSYLRGA